MLMFLWAIMLKEKLNILEGIYYCAFARSHRTSKDRELINWNADNALLSVSVGRERLDKRIDISILKDGKKSNTN